jgi:glycosyltransferase involved in cell wall biosynthesis
MACGTPVIAWNNGSVPEIIDHGQSGFIVSSMEEAENAIKDLSNISKKNVRQIFENKFSAKLMTENYLEAYEELIKTKRLSEFVGLYKGVSNI